MYAYDFITFKQLYFNSYKRLVILAIVLTKSAGIRGGYVLRNLPRSFAVIVAGTISP